MANTLRVLVVLGTRPEAIKCAPLIKRLSRVSGMKLLVCNTGQHLDMVNQVLRFFGISPDYNLRVMTKRQSLCQVVSRSARKLEKVINESRPDVLFVQGDTTTALVAALCGFYCKVKVAHLEAGLRSYDRAAPFPEEANRTLISRLADLHFAPTEQAKRNLLKDGVKKNVWAVGNTVVDAVYLGLKLIRQRGDSANMSRFRTLIRGKRLILVTVHRRENLGPPLERICGAITDLASEDETLQFVVPVHPNPNVRKTVTRLLRNVHNVHLAVPLDYPELLWLMARSEIILTDSGGIQEEAPSFGVPVIVLRQVTERTEGLDAGVAELVGTDRKRIVRMTRKHLDEKRHPNVRSKNPYGDGKASGRICRILCSALRS